MLHVRSDLTPAERDSRLSELDARHDRRSVMLVGESTLLALLLSGSLVVLFLLAQRRKQQREDMEKLLQFTSHEFKTPVAGVKGLLQSLAPRQHSRGATRRADPARPAGVRPPRAPGGNHPRLSARHVARAARRTVVHRRRALHRPICWRIAHAPRAAARCGWRRSTPCRCLPIAMRLRVILENLLDNAHKYGGGSVQLAAGAADGALAPRHQRPGTRFRARVRRKTLRSPQSRQRRRRHAWRGPGSRHRAPAGAPHGRRHQRLQCGSGAGRGVHRDAAARAADGFAHGQ